MYWGLRVVGEEIVSDSFRVVTPNQEIVFKRNAYLQATPGVLGPYVIRSWVLVFVIPVAPASGVGVALRSYAIVVINDLSKQMMYAKHSLLLWQLARALKWPTT